MKPLYDTLKFYIQPPPHTHTFSLNQIKTFFPLQARERAVIGPPINFNFQLPCGIFKLPG